LKKSEREFLRSTIVIASMTILVASLIGRSIVQDKTMVADSINNKSKNDGYVLEVKSSQGLPGPLSRPLQSSSNSTNQQASGDLQSQDSSANLQKNAGSSTLEKFNL